MKYLTALMFPAFLACSVPAFAQEGALDAGMIRPGKDAEACLQMRAGQELVYEFSSDTPMHFNIHYHVDEETTYLVDEKDIREKQGTLPVPIDQEYCLMWENKGRTYATLSYKFSVQDPAAE
jgi:hypothetical protein